ncbi:flagellar basal body P-ring protein FlgI [Buchnera aphidicola]|uniref:flagellar basal body P-ring protein FlgI n=1 Tax=Buchnera aphidicola TaxID=9 RepID=UPI0031B6BC43
MKTLLRYFLLCNIFINMILINFAFASENTIKNLTNISGAYTIPLIGYGLMVGLPNSGDQIPYSNFTLQTMLNLFKKMGIDVKNTKNIQTKNIASVMVTAELPAFNYIGQKIPIYVSSIGNSQNLQDGTLLMTPLKNSNGIRYGTAQGHCNLKIEHLTNINLLNNQNFKNNIKIKNGGIVEKTFQNVIEHNGHIKLQLKSKNFYMAQKISDIINKKYPKISFPLNERSIQIKVPHNKRTQSRLLANILHLKINTKKKKKI